ncbi:MAG TPA: hypothetical protein VF913_21810, partial [Xanthobacteraceae bacterium]
MTSSNAGVASHTFCNVQPESGRIGVIDLALFACLYPGKLNPRKNGDPDEEDFARRRRRYR